MTEMSAPKIQGVIFDWAGTTVDFGSLAPATAFVEIFRRQGIEITMAEARGPMGRAKRDHLAAIATLPRVANLWQSMYGATPDEAVLDRIYESFLPLQLETLRRHCDLIPGAIETVAACRQRGMKIGSTTGYTHELMDVVCPVAAASGYAPEVVICAGDTAAGRPAPWMIFRAAERMGVYPLSRVVIVDDSPVGIQAGRNAGVWTVAVTRTGNEYGLSQNDLAVLSESEVDQLERNARRSLSAAGAHFIIDGISSLLPILDEINSLLAHGQTPDRA